jgi:16S rRNA (guanine966-N2)-methyltransferase
MRIIAGALKGRSLKTISGAGYRPAMSKVRESLFSLLEARGVMWADTNVLDLFAGSGSLAFEAISRGTPKAYFVEKDPKAAACIKQNAEILGISDKCFISSEDAVKYVGRRPQHKFSVVFIDPPYAENFLPPTLNGLIRREWLEPGAFVIAEVEKHLKINTEGFEGLTLELDRPYGQTRILIWFLPE